jgi:hypothetical protein
VAIVVKILFHFSSVKTEVNFTELVLIEIFNMDDCLPLTSNESGSG